MAVKTMKGFTQRELDYIRESYRIKCDMDYQDEVVTAQRKARRAGRREEKLENARRMKADNMPVSKINKYTGLSPDIIAKL
ncbi:hypothetical protein R84B8_00696 [Treponema sp. R8-4-B8]